jgi:hypothetical protein
VLVVICALLALHGVARNKAPKWTKKAMTTSAEGIRYRVKKEGKGEHVKMGDAVRMFLYMYDHKTKKYDRVSSPNSPNAVNPKTGSFLELKEGTENNPVIRALRMMKAGGQAFFIVPVPGADSACYFMKVMEVIPPAQIVTVPQDSAKNDTINFKLPDPDQNRFGDTLFTTMKLVEVPIAVRCNGIVPTMQAVKFRITYFEDGVKHKDVLLYMECPSGYGKDFLVAGASYVVTAIPLLENHKAGKSVQNSYSAEKLESYYCLRIKKVNGQ